MKEYNAKIKTTPSFLYYMHINNTDDNLHILKSVVEM